MVQALSWIIPIVGVLLWVAVLPSTRALFRKKIERIYPEKQAETPAVPKSEKPTTQRSREEDPEILGFNREVVLSRFANIGKSKPETHESGSA
jgi:hypothetical protein